jgi:hypothetical protein
MMAVRLLCCALAGAFCVSSAGHAQTRCTPPRPIAVGSGWEEYLRTLQVLGKVPMQSWTVRSFTPRQFAALTPTDSSLPWANSMVPAARCRGAVSLQARPVEARLIYNSSFPFGGNDGAVWAGRGATAVLSGGLVMSAGPVWVQLEPVAFIAQNAAFALKPNGLSGDRAFADWITPDRIDLPQRFGDGAYHRLDPGNSSIAIDARWITFGVSTQNQFVGPATDHPILYGTNAAGFPHGFIQSSEPLSVPFVGWVHGRLSYGALSESRYSAFADSGYARITSSFVGTFRPALFPNLEVGAGRVFVVLYDDYRVDRADVLRPFGQLLNSAAPELAGDQLVSIFARVAFPTSGFEAYGEFGREDASADMRDFLLMPDHDAAYLIGFRKAWLRPASTVVVRMEILNTRVTHLALASTQAPWYVHSAVRQGFTNRGQVLGSKSAYGGGGAIATFERYQRDGRWRFTWERLHVAENRKARAPDLIDNDIAHAFGASVLRFGRRADIELGAQLVYEFNRYFGGDAMNLRTSLSVSRMSLRPSR